MISNLYGVSEFSDFVSEISATKPKIFRARHPDQVAKSKRLLRFVVVVHETNDQSEEAGISRSSEVRGPQACQISASSNTVGRKGRPSDTAASTFHPAMINK